MKNKCGKVLVWDGKDPQAARSSVPAGYRGHVTVVLPRRRFLVRYLRLPAVNKKEITAMLDFQLAKQLPFPVESCSYDWQLVGFEAGFSDIMVLVLQNQSAQEVIDALRDCQGATFEFTVACSILTGWFNSRFKNSDSNSVVVDIRENFVHLCVLFEGRLVFSREFDYKNRADILPGFEQSIAAAEKCLGKFSLEKRVITGMNIPDITKALDAQFFDHTSLDFAALPMPRMSFVPGFLRAHSTGVSRKRLFTAFIVIVLQVFLIGAIFWGRATAAKLHYVDKLNSSLAAMKVQSGQVKALTRRLKALERGHFAKGAMPQIVFDIVSVLPQGVTVSFMEIKEDNSFTLKGRAGSGSDVFSAAGAMNRSLLLKNAAVQYVTRVNGPVSGAVEYMINGKVR